MLTRVHKMLIGLLVVQLALAIVTLSRDDDAAPAKEQPILAGFDAAQVTRLQVFDGASDKPLDLVKQDTGWVLASSFQYPVIETKVTDVLSQLASMRAATPMATQASRHKQLRVADEDFARKLVVTAGGEDLTLYLGAPAGARRTAVRVGDDARVFAVSGPSTYAIATTASAWVEPSYVKLPRDELAKVVIQQGSQTTELSRDADGGTWTVTLGGAPLTLATGETLDTSAIDRIVDAAATIDLTSPADPARDASTPTATITLERKATGAASPAPTVIDVVAEGGSYWVRERGRAHAVLVDASRLEHVLGVTRDKLVTRPAEAGTTSQSSGTPSGASTTRSG